MANSIFLGKLNSDERKELIQRLWTIQKGKCFITGKDIDLQLHEGQLDIDHIIPLTNGGKDDESNFALTFSYANRSKQAADLNLARINWQFKILCENLQHSDNRNPNLTDILNQFGGAKYKLKYYVQGDIIKFSYAEIGRVEVIELPVYTDVLSKEKYFFTLLPIEYVYHDDKINPRSIGSNVSKLLAEFYKGNAQLHISLGYVEDNDEGASSNTQEQEQEEEKQSFVKESDLYGVWVVSGNAASLYFISFSEAGKYSYCFNSTMMGAGTYKLDKNKLTLYNGYLNTIDVVNLEKDNSQIKITGDLQKFKASTKQSVNISISKMNKELPISKTGEVFKIWGLHNTYGSTITYINTNQNI